MGCRAPNDAPELQLELQTLTEEEAIELGNRVGHLKNCSPISFVEQSDNVIRISCLADVPLGQAVRAITVHCNPDRGWWVLSGPNIFGGDAPGSWPPDQCDVTDPFL